MSSEKKYRGVNYNLTIVEASDLSVRSKGAPDVYATIKWGKRKYKTRVMKKTVNPVWNESFLLKNEPEASDLLVRVYNSGWSSSLIGQVKVSREELEKEERVDTWLDLSSVKRASEVVGRLRVLVEVEEEREDKKKKKEVHSVTYSIVEQPVPEEEPAFPNQRVRTRELWELSGVMSVKSVEVAGELGFMSKFLDTVEEMKPSLAKIQSNNVALRQIYGKYFSSTSNEQREELANQMSLLVDYSNAEAAKLNKLFKEIEESNAVAMKSVGIRGFEIQIRENIYNVISKTYMNRMVDFQDIQSQYKAMHRKTARKIYAIANPSATEKELEEVESLEMPQVLDHALSNLRRAKAKDALSYVKARHNEIIKIEQGLLEIQRMFNDMAVLVAAQAEFVDRIQANVQKAKTSTKEGLAHLREARYYQNHRFRLSPMAMAKLMK
ncbi:syntaxin-like [Schistocerca gregaria]|uniref:syntaxin-like n=1 Tax=Schistocerca gregaria TaxID=7010 RepID=UPI00211E4F0B|nr:syntaxin-like [Schistocerca gregaria]